MAKFYTHTLIMSVLASLSIGCTTCPLETDNYATIVNTFPTPIEVEFRYNLTPSLMEEPKYEYFIKTILVNVTGKFYMDSDVIESDTTLGVRKFCGSNKNESSAIVTFSMNTLSQYTICRKFGNNIYEVLNIGSTCEYKFLEETGGY